MVVVRPDGLSSPRTPPVGGTGEDQAERPEHEPRHDALMPRTFGIGAGHQMRAKGVARAAVSGSTEASRIGPTGGGGREH
ncbi:hypothetical protein GCM10010220_69280 [Streptomyces parvulus]|nr:hypothetical protein GCM10010220_69280 [Streptomyces parvulus]